MKVLQINQVYKFGSTGRIIEELINVACLDNIEMFVAYGYPKSVNNIVAEDNALCLQPKALRRKLNILRTRIFGHHGFYNEYETKNLIRWMDEIHPDIIHLHNIHNHYINIKLLFEYIKKHNIPIVWTLHDCWPFTGHCAYFDFRNCDRWKTECIRCQSIKDYPKTWFYDNTQRNYNEKRKIFTQICNIVFVSPSRWLHDLHQQSFLKQYPCMIINNGIDTSVFKPIKSRVREDYNIGNRKMYLAVSSGLAQRKGRTYLLDFSNYLNDDEVLVIVGLQKNQVRLLPDNGKVIGIQRTNTADELVGLYSEANVFINPTLEDNFPTTNIEALACGTPVVTFNTGGSIECVLDDEIIVSNSGDIIKTKVGAVVPQKDINALLIAAREICLEGKSKYQEKCREKAVKRYNKVMQYKKYIELYKNIYSRNDI